MPEQDPVTGKFVASAPNDVVLETMEALRTEEQGTPPPEVPAAPPVAEPAGGSEQELELYTVKVDGQEEQVTRREALDGYQRRETFNRRMEELHTDRQQFNAERDAFYAARGPTPSSPVQSYGAPPTGPLFQDGGQQYPLTDTPYPSYGQPGGVTPQPQQPWQEDPEQTSPEVMALRQDVRRLAAKQYRQEQWMVQQREEAMQEYGIGQLAKAYPDFDRAAVEERIYSLAPEEQARVRATMPKAAAYELYYLRGKAAGQTPAQTEPQASSIVNPPPVEGASGAGRQVGRPPLPPPKGPGDDAGLIAHQRRWEEDAKKTLT